MYYEIQYEADEKIKIARAYPKWGLFIHSKSKAEDNVAEIKLMLFSFFVKWFAISTIFYLNFKLLDFVFSL